jgi:hypothetical protein
MKHNKSIDEKGEESEFSLRKIDSNSPFDQPKCHKSGHECTLKGSNSNDFSTSAVSQSEISNNLDLKDLDQLCVRWLRVAQAVLTDLVGYQSVSERIASFRSRMPVETDHILSKMGIFLKLHEIEFSMVSWDEDKQEFGTRNFTFPSRTAKLGCYNEVKDIAVGMFGLISDMERVPVKQIYFRYEVAEDD